MSRTSFQNTLDKIEREGTIELLRRIAKQSELHEPYTGWWDGDNNLGILLPVTLNPVQGSSPGQYIPAPDQNTRGSGFKLPSTGLPQMWTVAIGPQYDRQIVGGAALDAEFEILCQVVFGCGGASRSTIINVRNGTTISGVANSIELFAFFDPLYIGEGQPQNMRVSVTLGRGRSLNPLPQRNIQQTLGIGATGAVVDITPFACKVSLTARTVAAANALFAAGNYLQFTDAAGFSPIYATIPLQGANPTTEFSVPPRARQVQLVNGSGAELDFYYNFHIGF